MRRTVGRVLISLGRTMIPSQRVKPTPYQLDSLVVHVAYEFAALEAAGVHYDEAGSWVYLEIFLLHARQLREFYFGRTDADRYAESSLFAEDYSPTWRGVRGGLPATLKSTKDAIDKQLAHIARERCDPVVASDLAQALPGLRQEHHVLWRRFLAALPNEARRKEFSDALRDKCKELGVLAPYIDAS